MSTTPRTEGADVLKAMALVVVDENQHRRKLLVEICRTLGVNNVTVVQTPTEALPVLAEAPFDGVIVAWTRPPLDAVQFVQAVRAHGDARVRRVPVVVMKPGATRADVAAARDSGANEFLSPPLTLQSVQQKLDSIRLRPRAFVEGGDFASPDRRRARGHEAGSMPARRADDGTDAKK